MGAARSTSSTPSPDLEQQLDISAAGRTQQTAELWAAYRPGLRAVPRRR